jgi:uncharacterized protein with HEPN domain
MRQTQRLTREEFLADMDAQDATAYRILAIGEVSKSLTEEMKSRYPRIPWRQILGMRNILAHEYFVREGEIIWETIQVGLPDLAAACRFELERMRPAEDTSSTSAFEILANLPDDMFAEECVDEPPEAREGLDAGQREPG